ncbi:Uncharacterized protein Adt_30962 [Abeliophyllum distichum]|uniref:Uncharacterized protein n=1 Tax=Abeliophyllum distichum TaxID=126358 RepID=A0ABD1RE46_9LAMI
MEKSILSDLLQLELEQANELHDCSQKVASDAIHELNQLKEETEQQRRKNLDRAAYVTSLETELEHLKMELRNTNEEEVGQLNTDVENMRTELEKIRTEMIESRERETGAQVEIALLKSELHNLRFKSKI